MTVMWERTVPKFCFTERAVISPEDFEALRVINGTPDDTYRMPAYAYARALIMHEGRTRWHIVVRQYQFGRPVFFARPIVIRAYRPEPD